MVDLEYLRKNLYNFLNVIPDDEFSAIIDTLLFRTTKKTKKSIQQLPKEKQIYSLVADMDFSIKDLGYNNLVNVLYQFYREKITVGSMLSMEEIVNSLTPNKFLINTIYILYKFCRAPYIGRLYDLFESKQYLECINNLLGIETETSEKIQPKEKEMKYYIGYIDKRGTYYNFKPEYVFDGKAIRSDDTLKEEFPIHGKFNLSYKFHKESESFLEKVKLHNLYAINAEELNFKDNRNRIDNSIVEDVQKQVDLQEMFENGTDISKVICLAQELGIYKVVYPRIVEIDNNFVDGIIEVSNQNYAKNDLVLLAHRDMLVGPYQLEVRPIDNTFYVKPNLGNSNHKYIKKYIENTNNERVFSVSIYVDYKTNKTIDFSYFDLNELKSEDIIPDEILLSELNKIYNIDTESKGKTTFDRLTKHSEFLSSELSEEVKASRIKRLESQFETFNILLDSKKLVLKTLIDSDWNEIDDPQIKRMLDEKLENSTEYLDIKGKLNQSSERCDDLLNEKTKIEKELARLKEEQSEEKRVEQQTEEKKTEISKLTIEFEKIKKEKERLENLIIDIREELTDWQKIKNRNEEIKKLDTLLEDRRNQKIKLDNRIEKAKGEFKSEIRKSFDEAKIAFDPVISNMMIDSASDWQNKDKDEKYLSYCKNITEKAKTIRTKSNEELSDYIINGVRKYRNYQYNDIINMYICISQSFLTVFAGNPGTGKTSICNIIANSLGLNETLDKEHPEILRFVPVSVERGWSSKRDLIGYYNPLTKKYDKSNGKIYDALRILDIEKENSKFPLLVLLDEANLSPIEYYWAEFMRIADRENDSTKINIGEENDLFVPETLRFVATINYDQTTEELSPRLIDRAWIIKLPTIEMDYTEKPDIKSVFKDLILWSDLKEVFYPHDSGKGVELSDVLDQIYEEFSNVGIPISYRVKESINKYVSVAQRLMQDDSFANAKNQAVDYAVMQKLLPKISGNGYKEFLERLIKICDDNRLVKTKSAIDEMITQAEYNLGYCQYL